ncbi:MAG: rhamnulokinase [Treponema sp.]|jgi:rhamnulokinase|nr:rhamnulokinase [Treponema sp.]
MDYYLAIDIGASSGRHILGWIDNGRINIEELYRFENAPVKQNGHLCWDIDGLFRHVVEGLKRAALRGKNPLSIGIDTWGVDFVLLDAEKERLGDCVSYRDNRTAGMDAAVEKYISFADLYARTGIQKQPFNTIYQLMALKEAGHLPEKARHFLMIPDYLHYRLTGFIGNEYTNATTTALVNAETKTWDYEILRILGLPEHLFKGLRKAGDTAGPLLPEIAAEAGFSCSVTLPATHDTGSAFMAVPVKHDGDTTAAGPAYLSSGTWSLLGIENTTPVINTKSMRGNWTNEGGYGGSYRFLKNIMGLWMVQSVRNELGKKHSFSELALMAEEAADFESTVSVNDNDFLSPASMIEAVKNKCIQTGQKPPAGTGEIMQCLYHSLAQSYREAVLDIEDIAGKRIAALHIVGGGSKDDYLNALTSRAVGIPVYAGPAEATVIGNLTAQMIANGTLADLNSARLLIAESFDIKQF